MSNGQPFYGKYRGIVSDNRDPLNMGRIRARIPDVLGENECGWALPSLPYAGNGVGLFLLPPLNSSVWMEFEQGNPDYPIWTGCFWAKEGDAPLTPAVPEKKLLKTDTGTITLDDTPGSGGVFIETTAGMKISIDSASITIDDGQGGSIKLTGPQVSINDGALEVV